MTTRFHRGFSTELLGLYKAAGFGDMINEMANRAKSSTKKRVYGPPAPRTYGPPAPAEGKPSYERGLMERDADARRAQKGAPDPQFNMEAEARRRRPTPLKDKETPVPESDTPETDKILARIIKNPTHPKKTNPPAGTGGSVAGLPGTKAGGPAMDSTKPTSPKKVTPRRPRPVAKNTSADKPMDPYGPAPKMVSPGPVGLANRGSSGGAGKISNPPTGFAALARKTAPAAPASTPGPSVASNLASKGNFSLGAGKLEGPKLDGLGPIARAKMTGENVPGIKGPRNA